MSGRDEARMGGCETLEAARPDCLEAPTFSYLSPSLRKRSPRGAQIQDLVWPGGAEGPLVRVHTANHSHETLNIDRQTQIS
jgi:hypothetical protein